MINSELHTISIIFGASKQSLAEAMFSNLYYPAIRTPEKLIRYLSTSKATR